MIASHRRGHRAPDVDGPGTEIDTLAAKHWTSVAIAGELVLSVRTVENLYRAYAKFGVHRRAELAEVLATSG